MGRYSDFTLYCETWGGYPHRKEPFGLPTLTWYVATAQNAARCVVESEVKGPMTVTWSAEWQLVPRELLDPIPGLLEEAGAFGEPVTILPEDAAVGDYLGVVELTGALHDRPFHLSLQWTGPPFEWPAQSLGRRLSDCLTSLSSYQPGHDR